MLPLQPVSNRPILSHALVADDSRIARALTVEILKEFGVKVREAADGREALHLALQERPDLLVLDGLMPGLNAFDLLAQLRERDKAYLPVVVIQTAMYKSRRWESEARSTHGVAEYLEKPVEPETFIAALKRHFTLPGSHPQKTGRPTAS